MAIRKRRLRSVKLTDSVVVDCDQPYVDVIPYALSGEQKEIAMIVVDGVSSIISAPSGGEISSVEIDPKYDFGMCLAEISVNTVSARIMAPVDEVLSGGSNLVNSHAITNALSGLSSECALTGNFSEDFDIGPDGKISLFKELTIDSFSVTSPASVNETGKKVSQATLSWNLSKFPAALSIDGVSIVPPEKTRTGYNVSFSELSSGSKSFTITVVDNRNVKKTKNASFSFAHKMWFGASSRLDFEDGHGNLKDDFLNSLQTALNDEIQTTFKAELKTKGYIWYVCLTSNGDLVFDSGIGSGGFDLLGQLYQHTGPNGHKATYEVFRSENELVAGTYSISVSKKKA